MGKKKKRAVASCGRRSLSLASHHITEVGFHPPLARS